MKKEYLIIGGITLFVLAGIIGISYRENNTPGKLDGFAQCLKDKGAIFYGAFWCPHCQNQKKMFGRSASVCRMFDSQRARPASRLQRQEN